MKLIKELTQLNEAAGRSNPKLNKPEVLGMIYDKLSKKKSCQFDFPDYAGLPKKIANGLSSEFVDGVQSVCDKIVSMSKDKWVKLAQSKLKELGESKWSNDVKTKVTPPEGLFTKPAKTIAKWLKANHKDEKSAMASLNFYINRAGKNLSAADKGRLAAAQQMLKEGSASGVTLKGWKIVNNSFVSKGADPTAVTVYELTKSGKKITVTEFFGDWSVKCGSEDIRGLTQKKADEYLKKQGAPSIVNMFHEFDEDEDYSDDPMGHPNQYK